MTHRRNLSTWVAIVAVGITVACDGGPTGPGSGTIEVELIMMGPAFDPDGCAVSVDGSTAQTIYSGESKEYGGLVAGSHVVWLSDLAEGCTVSGENPRAVEVDRDDLTTARFEVSCEEGPATGTDPLMALLSGGTYEKVQPMDSVVSVDSLDELRDDGYWSCTVESRSAVDAPDDYATFNPNAEIIYPGSMLQGATLVNATPEPIVVPRAGGTFVINLLNGSSGVSQSVDQVRQSTVVQAINDILAANTGIVPARFTYNSSEVQSREQMALSLGVNVSTLSMDFRSKMNFSMDQQYNRFLVQMIQSFYTVSFDLPESVHDLIAPGVTGAQVAPYVGPGNPATYISSVTYGRRFFLLVESTSSVMDMKASIQASYDAAIVSGDMDMNVSYVKDLNSVNIKVFALGGDQSMATAMFNGDFDAIKTFLTEGADIRTGVPLSYVVRNVADNSIVNVKVATDYDIKTCIPMLTEQLFSGFADHTEGWSSYGNGSDPQYSPVVHMPLSGCGGGMGGCAVFSDYLSETLVGVVPQTMYFRAPWSWISNRSWSDFYGGTIDFYMRFQWGFDWAPAILGWLEGFNPSLVAIPSLVIEGPAGTLTLLISNNDMYVAQIGWTLYSINLDETETPYGFWQYGGHAATQQEIQDVLAEVTDFRIRGDLVYGTEWTWLDGVSVKGPAAGGP